MQKLQEVLDAVNSAIHDEIKKTGGALDDDELDSIAALCRNYNEICNCMEHFRSHSGKGRQAGSPVLEAIEEELEGAEEYYAKWLETKDEMYKTLAKDELRHSEMLMNAAKKDGVDVDGVTQPFRDLPSKIARM